MMVFSKLTRLRELLQGMCFTGELTYVQMCEVLAVDGEISKLQKETLQCLSSRVRAGLPSQSGGGSSVSYGARGAPPTRRGTGTPGTRRVEHGIS
jgi:hypothetical protein